MPAFPDHAAIMGDLKSLIETGVPALAGKVVYPPPEQSPISLTVYLEYGPVTMEWDGMETVDHTITIVVCVPRGLGAYSAMYDLISRHAQSIYQALKLGIVLAGEVVLVGPFSISPASGGSYQPGNDPVVSAQITLHGQSKEGLHDVQI